MQFRDAWVLAASATREFCEGGGGFWLSVIEDVFDDEPESSVGDETPLAARHVYHGPLPLPASAPVYGRKLLTELLVMGPRAGRAR